jgi:hypothetical protein
VCVYVWATRACASVNARGVFGGKPQRPSRDVNATSRPCRGVDAHGEAVARAWRGWARSGLAARVRTHARGFWFSRTAAWPCRARGTGIPGPRHDAAAKGDGSYGARRRRDGLLHTRWHGGRKGRVVLWLGYGGFIGGARHHAGSTGKEGNGDGVAHRWG